MKVYQGQYESVKKQTTLLSDQLKNLKEKHEELENKKLVLLSRLNVAKVSNDVGKTVVSIYPENAVKGFRRLEEQILNLEAKAQANQILDITTNGQDIFLKDQVETELAKIKEATQKAGALV